MDAANPSVDSTPTAPATALIVGTCETTLWQIDGVERLRRELAAKGVRNIRRDPTDVPLGSAPIVVLRADFAYDGTLLRALIQTPGLALLSPDGDTVVGVSAPAATAVTLADALAAGRLTSDVAREHGLTPRSAADAAGAYRDALRKRETPYLLPVLPAHQRALERRLFGGAYKGVTDFVTKYAWPEPAFWVTQACARLGITPNAVTFVSLVMVVLAFYCFAQGQFAVGLLAAWLMTFLDTVDGKLARVTVTYTRLGGVFDHAIDLIHPPFWYWAWLMGVQASGSPLADADILLAVIAGGYVLQRVEEGIFIARHGVEMHVWRRLDSLFRLVTARRNPNLIILTVALLAGRPDLGIVAVAWWTALCFGVHLLRLAQAEQARRAAPITSWLNR